MKEYNNEEKAEYAPEQEQDEYAMAEKARDENTADILKSDARTIVIVASPGTGKTYLFEEMIAQHGSGEGKVLVTSFSKELVGDLRNALNSKFSHEIKAEKLEVKTLHALAFSELKIGKNDIYEGLEETISEDYEFCTGKEIDYVEKFTSGNVNSEELEFYRERKKYYGGSYGFNEMVHCLFELYSTGKKIIPVYDLVVVDEYQDFTKLEVKLIEVLVEKAKRSLIVGDDDQMIHDFKGADGDGLKKAYKLAKDTNETKYESFNLPWGQRSPKVIVDAVNELIDNTTDILTGRIDKELKYFPDKPGDSNTSSHYPKIIYTQMKEDAIPEFIKQQLDVAKQIESNSPSTLVICQWNSFREKIKAGLENQGFNVAEPLKTYEEERIAKAFNAIGSKDAGVCSLGWRILLGYHYESKKYGG